MTNGQDVQRVTTPHVGGGLDEDTVRQILSIGSRLFGRAFDNIQDFVEAFGEQEFMEALAKGPQIIPGPLAEGVPARVQAESFAEREERRTLEAEAEAEAALLQRVTAAREEAGPDEEGLEDVLAVTVPVEPEEEVGTKQLTYRQRLEALVTERADQAEKRADAFIELAGGRDTFLLSYGEELPFGVRGWLKTDAAMSALSKDFDIDAFELAASPALAFLVQEMDTGGLLTRYQDFTEEKSPEAIQLVTDLMRGGIPPRYAEDHNLNAFFQGNLTKHLDELTSDLSPGIAGWVKTEAGRTELYEQYLKSIEFASSFETDQGVDPISFIQTIDDEYVTNVWADTNVSAAIDRSVRQQVAGLPAAVREKVASQIYSSLYSRFNDQLFDVGGVPRLSTFLRSVNFSEFDPEIDFAINEYRTGTAGITPRALLSPEFFGQSMGSLFSQATATLLEDLGRDPSFPEIQEEVQAIQTQQIEDYTAEGGDLPPFGGPMAPYDAREAAGRAGGPGWPGVPGQPNVGRPFRPFPRPFFVNR
jgi:hypothetical protein